MNFVVVKGYKEKTDLMMFDSSNQTCYSYNEKEDSTGYDTTDDVKAGDV